MSRYLIISPVRNEQEFIRLTIRSVKNQTVQPEIWIIVNDDSEDNTRAIVEAEMQDYDRIALINRKNNDIARKRGKRIVEAFYDGLHRIQHDTFDYIVKLDGDMILPANYFERIFQAFDHDPKLGITSGVSYVKEDGHWVPEHTLEGHTFGASKVYRVQCFKDIGGLFPGMGWDGIDQMKALMLGWHARSISDLMFYHLRPMGRGTGRIKAAFEEGTGCYTMGYHPIYFLLRALKRSKNYSFVGGAAMMYGYLKSAIAKADRVDDPRFIRFIRRNQIRRLLSGGRKKSGHW